MENALLLECQFHQKSLQTDSRSKEVPISKVRKIPLFPLTYNTESPIMKPVFSLDTSACTESCSRCSAVGCPVDSPTHSSNLGYFRAMLSSLRDHTFVSSRRTVGT